jgi:hypothetical protein
MPVSPGDPIGRIVDELTAVIDWARTTGNRLGYFAALYRRVTIAVRAQIDAFADPPRMERLDVTFARRYLDALAAWRQGSPTTTAWQVAFTAAADPHPIILQHLLVGMNAHINLDLGIAAARTSPGDELPSLRGDFLRINALLGGLVGTVISELGVVSPRLGLLSHLVGRRDDDAIANFSLAAARDFAWHVAESLAPLPLARQEGTIATLDRLVGAFGRHLVHPDELLAALYRVLREAETSSVPQVIDVLATPAQPGVVAGPTPPPSPASAG